MMGSSTDPTFMGVPPHETAATALQLRTMMSHSICAPCIADAT